MLKSLSSKLIAIFISITVLVVLITSIIFMLLFYNYAVSEKEKAMFSCAQEIARLVSQDKASSYSFRKRTISDNALFSERILDSKLWVVGTDGVFDKIGAVTKSPLNIKELSTEQENEINNSFKGISFSTKAFSEYFQEETLSVLVPMMSVTTYDGDRSVVTGSVILHCSTVNINAGFFTAQMYLVVAIVFAVFIAVTIAIALSMRISRPLRQMSEAATKMADGNYNVRVESSDKGELGALSASLNNLSKTLSNTIVSLKSEKDNLNIIIDNISDGLASYDINGKLLKYNSALLQLCTYEILEDDRIRCAMKIAMEKREQQTVILEGSDILKFSISPSLDGDTLLGVIVIVKDISQSERLERTRREFVSNVSHEFRTPLTIIKGSMELLVDSAITNPSDIMQTYRRIENETVALEHLVKDLLDVSRLKAGKIQLDLKDVDLSALIEEIVKSMSLIASKKSVSLKYDNGSVPKIRGDFDRIRQLIIIFIDNAIKFTPRNGTISISTLIRDNMACIKIKDTGKGIPKEDIPYIFERFYKADKSRGGSKTGTGLGLSIANNIVELHGGGITVESEVGKGTEFSIMLPLA